MSHLIRLEEAVKTLGVSQGTLHGKKYDDFRLPSENGKAYFDIGAYTAYADLQEELVEKVKLFIEYLYHIEGMSYQKMARLSGVNVNSLHSHIFSYQRALRIAVGIREFYPLHLKRFDEYYSWRTTCKKPIYKLTLHGWTKRKAS